MITLPRKQKRSNRFEIEMSDFKGGSNLLVDDARAQPNQAIRATNLIQKQDGIWATRPGRNFYGQALPDNCTGAAEFLKDDGVTEIIAIAGDKAYRSTNGGSWTEITGATFTAGTQVYFLQIAGFLYIYNGVDPLVRYNGTVLDTFAGISAPTGLSASRTGGLTSGSFTYWGIVTAMNDVGETIGSTGVSIDVNKLRDTWIAGTDKVRWTWNSVAGATRYQLYLSDEEGDESFLISVSATEYEDDGSVPINPFVKVPLDDTTSAPKFKSAIVSGNRMWATNDSTEEYIVRFTGAGQALGKFSPFFGGGWINLERGGREKPSVVVHYQSGQGEGRATILCRTPEGKGAVWQVNLDVETVGDTSFTVPSAQKVVGSFGTEAILGVVGTENDIMFPNKSGWFGLGPRQNFFGILRTNELSSIIRPYWRSLVGNKMEGICAYFYDAKVYISVPTTTQGNSKTIILDTERRNWTIDWTFGARQFFEYTDSNGRSRLLYVPVNGDRLVEISDNIQGDFGQPFETDYTSPRMPLRKEWSEFDRVRRVYVKLGNPRGSINFEVSGTERNKPFRALKSTSINPLYALTGTGYDPTATVLTGDTDGDPRLFTDKADIRYVDVRKKIRDIQLRITSNSSDTEYAILGFIIKGTRTMTRPPRTWKVS
jgi:hypothetical protein